MSDFGSSINISRGMSSLFNAGTVKGIVDDDVEFLEIEPLHTTINGESIIILIEPVDLTINNSVSIGMAGSGQLYGRADPIPSYTGTQRRISISFKMVKSYVLNGPEAVSGNTLTANLLQQLSYASYTPTAKQNTSVLKTPPYFRILYGDLIGDFKGGQRKGLPGFFQTLSVSSDGSGGALGANLTYGLSDTVLPIEYSVRLEFSVMHDHVVGWYDGKFAGDGRNNWPYNSGIVINQTPDGPGNTGGNPQGDPPSVPGSPAEVTAKAAQSDSVKMNHKNNSNDIKKGAS